MAVDNELQVRLLHAVKTHDNWKKNASNNPYYPKRGEVCLESVTDGTGLKYKIKIGDANRPFAIYTGSDTEHKPLSPDSDWDFTSSSVLPYFGTVVTASGSPQVCSFYTYTSGDLDGTTVIRIYDLTLSSVTAGGETTITLNTSNYREIRPGSNIAFNTTSDSILTIVASMDFSSLDTDSDIALAEWHEADPQVSGDTNAIRIYEIKEVNGIISKGTDFIEIKVSSPLEISNTNGVITISIKDGTTSQKGAVQLSDTYTTGTDGNYDDSTKAATNSSITAALGTLDGTATTLDNTSSDLDVINTVSETNGIVSSTKKTLTAGNKIDITAPTQGTDAGKIIVDHETITTTITDNTNNPNLPKEREVEIITAVTTDDGHVIAYTKDKSTNIIAGDLKAPVKEPDDSTWNYRETGGDITIGEDTARIPSLKGNTLVWNQVVQNGNFADTSIWSKNSALLSVSNNVGTVVFNVTNANITQTLELIQTHKYYFCGSIKTLSNGIRLVIDNVYNSNPILNDDSWIKVSSIITSSDTYGKQMRVISYAESATADVKNIMFIDLTKLFGSDEQICEALGVTVAELTTDKAVQAFEKLFPNPYYPYCEGRLVNLGGYGVKWNQLYDTTVPTAVTDHKYYLSEVVSSTKTSSISTTISYTSGSTNRMCVDLTMMFGPGSEPTLEEFEAMFPNDYYEYDAGTEMNIFDAIGDKKLGLESTGFNQWDGTYTVNKIMGSDGTITNRPSSENLYGITGYISVLPDTDYYLKTSRLMSSNDGCAWFDANKNYISGNVFSGTGVVGVLHSPLNAAYLVSTIIMENADNTCINISSSRDGEYEPYKKDTLDLDWIREIEYTPDGSSTPEKLFPYGLLSAGSVHDEVTETKAIKRVGVVDLGTLKWNKDNGVFYSTTFIPLAPTPKVGGYYVISSKYIGHAGIPPASLLNKEIQICNASSSSDKRVFFKDSAITSSISTEIASALKGVMLYYELATPIEIPIYPAKNMSYLVDDLGTETQLPVNPTESTPINAPFVGTFEYQSNFKDAIRDLFDKVNHATNPVKGITNTNQTTGKLAVYDSPETTASSQYEVSPTNISPSGTDNAFMLPTVAQIITYINNVVSSTLTYKGTVSEWEELPTTGQSNGDLWIASAVITHDENTYYPGTFFIWNSDEGSEPSNPHWDIVASNTTISDGNPILISSSSSTTPEQYTVGTINGESLHVRVPDLPTFAGNQTSGNVLVGNGNSTSWRGLKLDETVNNDTNSTSISSLGTGLLERYDNGQLTDSLQWRLADPSAVNLINPTNSNATSGKVLVGNYDSTSETHNTPPSWRNLKLDELSHDGTDLIPILGTGFLKRAGTDSWSLTDDTLTWKDETNNPTYTEVTSASTDKGLTNFIHNYSEVTTIELGSYGTTPNITKDGFRINIPLITSDNALEGTVLQGNKVDDGTTISGGLPTWSRLKADDLSDVYNILNSVSSEKTGYFKRVDKGASANPRYVWEFDPYGGGSVMPYKSNSAGTGDVATSSKTTAEINALTTVDEKILARTALREQVGNDSYIYHKISVGALENDSNIVLILNGNFS